MSLRSRLASGVARFVPRAFEAGRNKRRLLAIPSTAAAINSLIRRYGDGVVARSRYLATNNPYAVAAKEAFTSALVGDGIKPSSLVKDDPTYKAELQQLWTDWTDEADADGLTDLYGLQALIAAELFEAGECFVRLRQRRPEDGLAVPLQLQLLPSEMLPLSKNEVLAGNRVECGIEFNAIGQRVAYHFRRQHPGSELTLSGVVGAGGTSAELVRIPAEQVLHLYRPIRVGQIRGVPHTLSGLVTMAMVDLYDDAELERKRMAALFGAFVTKPTNDDSPGPLGVKTTSGYGDEADDAFSLEPGAVVDLRPGEDIKFGNPADVGPNYEAFQYRMLLRAAAGFGTPYSDMTGDLRQTSYGSIRAGLIGFRRRIGAMQNHIMVFQFCRPVWARFNDEAALAGALGVDPAAYKADRRNLTRVKWITPKWEWIDPLKDRQAEALAVRNGFKPRSDVQNAEGYDPEEVDAQIMADNDRADAADLTLDSDPRRTTQAGQLQIQAQAPGAQQASGDNPTADDADPADQDPEDL